jgi:predicted AAA+ superfamily ATPase
MTVWRKIAVMKYKREQYVRQLLDKQGNGLIKVITGLRRSGKSYLLTNLFLPRIISDKTDLKDIVLFAFDKDEDLDKLLPFFPEEPLFIEEKGEKKVNSHKFRAFIQNTLPKDGKHQYLLLDEIQRLEDFSGTLNSYLDKPTLDVYVTGSNSHLLSSEIATEFKGRSSLVHLLPLSFSEFSDNKSEPLDQLWAEYIFYGGMPVVVNEKTDFEKRNTLNGLIDNVYLNDIVTHNKIKSDAALKKTLEVIASSIGLSISPVSLSNTFKSKKNATIDNETIDRYMGFYKNCFLTAPCYRYDIKGKQYIEGKNKVFFEDVGLRNALTGWREIEESHLMENILFNELRYRGYEVSVGSVEIRENTNKKDVNGKDIYTKKQVEVDFVATNGNEKYYIQSAYTVGLEEKRRQEIRPLINIDDSFKKIVVTKDVIKPWYDDNGVLTINLFDFLLTRNF